MTFTVALLFSGACGTPPPTPSTHSEPVSRVEPQAEIVEKPRFIVVSRNAPLFHKPDIHGDYLQFRTDEAQAERDRHIQNQIQEDLANRQERYAKEVEREKKRIKRIKDAKKRSEYVEKRRQSRARRHLKALTKSAKRAGEGDPSERFIALRIIGAEGDFYHVENLLGDEELAHCYRNGLRGLGHARLQFWVRKHDAERVTTRRERLDVWRGSALEVAAGVVVRGDTAIIDGYQFSIPTLGDLTAQTYSPGGTFEAPYTDTTFTDIALAEGRLEFSRDQTIPFNPWVDVYVTATLYVGKRFYATFQTHCAAVTVHADEEDLAPVGTRKTMRLSASDPPASAPYVEGSAPIFHPDGTPFGVAQSNTSLGEAIGDGCYKKKVWKSEKGADHRIITWCANAESVVSQ